MTARKSKSKKRARPHVAIPVARQSAAASEAIAALDQSAPLQDLQELTSADVAGAAPQQSTTPLASRDADSAMRESTRSAAASVPSPASAPPPSSSSSSSSSAAAKKAPAPKASLTGAKFSGLNRDQLRTLAAVQENKLAELEAALKTQVKAAAAVPVWQVEDFEEPLGESWAMLYELLAMKWGDEFLLDEKQQGRMGRVWAAPTVKFVELLTQGDPEQAAFWTPILLALGITGGITASKVRKVIRRRDEEKKSAAGAT